jgi:hypothetical protein
VCRLKINQVTEIMEHAFILGSVDLYGHEQRDGSFPSPFEQWRKLRRHGWNVINV